MSDLVGNPKVWFSRDAAHIILGGLYLVYNHIFVFLQQAAAGSYGGQQQQSYGGYDQSAYGQAGQQQQQPQGGQQQATAAYGQAAQGE